MSVQQLLDASTEDQRYAALDAVLRLASFFEHEADQDQPMSPGYFGSQLRLEVEEALT